MAGTTDHVSNHGRWSLPPDLPPAGNVLLAAPPMTRHTDDVCAAMATPASDQPVTLLYLTFTRAASHTTPAWMNVVGESFPARLRIVSVGSDPVAGVPRYDGRESPSISVSTETVSDPADLTAIGIALTKHLEDRADGGRVVACIRSITGLLQYADRRRAYQFLDVVTEYLSSVDALAHFHVDPGAHDEQTISTLTALFDAVVEVGDDSELVTRSR